MLPPRVADYRPRAAIEWRTGLHIVTVCVAWLLAGCACRVPGPVIGTAAWTLATCWFIRLQHELIYNLPTRSKRNGGFVVPGCLWWVRLHALVPVDSPIHPLPADAP